jgi:hypothetical protein
MRLFTRFIALGVTMAVALESWGEVTFRYCENDDGDNTITLLRCVPPQRNLDKFVIPSTYQGKTVTRIGEDFFDEAGNVTSLDADCDRSLSVYPFE